MSEIKKYGENDTDKWVKEMSMSREIVLEILKYGTSQTQDQSNHWAFST